MNIPSWLLPATILQSEVGSTLHGIGSASNDLDLMGVCLEPLHEAFGLHKPFEQVVYRTAEERDGKNARSQAGDVDLVVYSLRKWTMLALDGNPTVLLLLFAPDDKLTICDGLGYALRDLAPEFASKQAGHRFLGYMQSQKAKLTGERGGRDVNRHDLVEKFGYDTKYAAHSLRLGYQGIEYLATGKITLPMAPAPRATCQYVRDGHVPLMDFLVKQEQVESDLKEALAQSTLPERPNTSKVEDFVLDAYQSEWDTLTLRDRYGILAQ